MERLMRLLGYVRAEPQAQPQPPQQPQLQAEQPAELQPEPQRLAPIVIPEADEAAIGPMRGSQFNRKRKQKFDDIARNSVSSYPKPGGKKSEYRTVETEGWLTLLSRRPEVVADNPPEISDSMKKALFALMYISSHQITRSYLDFVLKECRGLGASEQAIRKRWEARFRGWQHEVCTVYVSPRAEAFYISMISRSGADRVDLLALTDPQRQAYTNTQWPQDVEEQKRLVFNMYSSMVQYLDLDAIFDPPDVCTQEQLAHCATIRYSLQCSFVFALDAYINIRIRYREGIQANGTYRLPHYPKVNSAEAAGRVFLDYWRCMPKFRDFPKFPHIKYVPVVPERAERKRQRMVAAPAPGE